MSWGLMASAALPAWPSLSSPILSTHSATRCSDPDKLFFLAQLLLPLLGVPLLAGVGPWIVAVPGFATLLLSSYRAQYLLDTHYSAIVMPAIFFLAVLGLARIEQRRRVAVLPVAAALLTASLLMNWQFGWLGGKLFDGIPQPTERATAP